MRTGLGWSGGLKRWFRAGRCALRVGPALAGAKVHTPGDKQARREIEGNARSNVLESYLVERDLSS